MEDRRLEFYTSRSLNELQNRLESCTDEYERLIISARKAANLARLTRTAEAREIVKHLRLRNPNFEPRLSAWIMFCDGIILHFESLPNFESYDRFRRAYVFAAAVQDRELAGSCAAWIAKCELVAGHYSSMFESLIAAFKWSDICHGDARARASMVIADSLNYAGDIDHARRWYARARRHAIEEGDISMQNVMLFNLAAFGLMHLTLDDCLGTVQTDKAWRVMMEVNSAVNLDRVLGSKQLLSLTPLLEAELQTVQGKWSEALELFDMFLERSLGEGHASLQARLLSHCAWCSIGAKDHERSRKYLENAIFKIQLMNDPDDLAITHFRVRNTAKALGDMTTAAEHDELGHQTLKRFRDQQMEVLAGLNNTLNTFTKFDSEKITRHDAGFT